MKTLSLRLALAASLFSIVNPQLSTVLAQGSAFTYQGRLNDGVDPASGVYDLRFVIYDAINGGAQNGPTVTLDDAPVSNGLFTVTLDFGSAVFNGNARWLEIGVRQGAGTGAFTTLSPRQPITPAPYAVRAGNVTGAVSANQLSGTIPLQQLPSAVLTNGATSVNLSGSFTGNGAGLTSISGASITGTIPTTALAISSNPLVQTAYQHTKSSPRPDRFGASVAVVMNSRVLIGAPQGTASSVTDPGAAYLYEGNGQLVHQFRSPYELVSGGHMRFGSSVAALGSDRVLIGAPEHGYDLNAGFRTGQAFIQEPGLWTTLLNPTPEGQDAFGYSVAGVGANFALVGAPLDDTVATDAGAVYLFARDATLVTTFLNPLPSPEDFFGFTVASFGTDRVLISAPSSHIFSRAGAVHLFSTNGTLLMTIANPSPGEEDKFGVAVAKLGDDRIVIGAPGDDTFAIDSGSAYLFDTNGNLMAIFSNPTPGVSDEFGQSIAVLDNDRVVIGAPGDDTGVLNSGSLYVFNASGVLLETISPAMGLGIGSAIAAYGTDRVVAGSAGTEEAFLFHVRPGTFSPGVIAESVRDHSITEEKLSTGIGVWKRNGSDVYRPVGHVGIGTASPVTDLHLSGPDSRVLIQSTDAAGYSATEYATGGRTWHSGVGGQTTGPLAGKYYLYDATAQQTRMVVDPSGNVGIGTNSPAATLDVNGSLAVRGAVRFPGAGIASTTPVFIHRASVLNIETGAVHRTTIDHPLCNNDGSAILIVTQNYNARGSGNVSANHSVGVYYNPALGRWQIFHQNIQPIEVNTAWNVLVVKQ